MSTSTVDRPTFPLLTAERSRRFGFEVHEDSEEGVYAQQSWREKFSAAHAPLTAKLHTKLGTAESDLTDSDLAELGLGHVDSGHSTAGVVDGVADDGQAPLSVRARRPGRRRKVLDMRAGKRPKPTFANAELENEFLLYCQMASPTVLSASQLEARRQELLKASSDYIHLQEFDEVNAEELICGATLLEPVGELEEGMQPGLEDLMFARLCTRRLLRKPEETSVVKRLHYYKFLAFQILSAASVDQWSVARAEGLVRAAYWHRSLVIQSNVRLVVSIVRKLPVSPCFYDELVSDGILGMVRALDRFDPSRGYRFCTYATTVIRRECFQNIQEFKKYRKQVGHSAALSVLNSVKGLAEVTKDRSHWVIWRHKLVALLSKLSPREQTIIRARYGLGTDAEATTLQSLADMLKLSKERVRQLERSALQKLKSLADSADFPLDDLVVSDQPHEDPWSLASLSDSETED